MKRLTFDGNFCENVALCGEVLGGNYCENDGCKQRQIWERLKMIENFFGDDYDIDRLRELIEADRGGRCVVLQSQYAETTGGEALRRAMYVCAFTNNEVKRYTADAIAEKVVRESKKALEEMEESKND